MVGYHKRNLALWKSLTLINWQPNGNHSTILPGKAGNTNQSVSYKEGYFILQFLIYNDGFTPIKLSNNNVESFKLAF